MFFSGIEEDDGNSVEDIGKDVEGVEEEGAETDETPEEVEEMIDGTDACYNIFFLKKKKRGVLNKMILFGYMKNNSRKIIKKIKKCQPLLLFSPQKFPIYI